MKDIGVIIPAMNAQDTIGRAVASALVQNEVSEVVVVDDASRDHTAQAARAADDGSGRLKVIASARNLGPAGARNLAIAQSFAPHIAILDADDFLLAGRFAALADPEADWDLSADNVVFASAEKAQQFAGQAAFDTGGMAQRLTFERFVRANMSRPDRPRGEFGFLKPVIRRAFLEQHNLAYNERLRLGEDFELYARMLLAGARFRIIAACGYVAVESATSLSANHSAADLAALVAADQRMLDQSLSPTDRSALAAHHAQCAERWHHRHFLDAKRERGLVRALAENAALPRLILDAAKGVAQDKWRDHQRKTGGPTPPPEPRFLVGP
ncbi:glycosyltransferase family 2 protein [Erythrobacter sp.]|uniref:glycosyltransferase family 2 protein n=1 Tax=Erythrobacter sp. TaxID=1042 RepID=UPI0025F63A1E|nr:glycosyltransferase family 2 protein [Erythrobacter sp.]